MHTVFLLLLACSTERDIGSSAEWESCSCTADCQSALRCVQGTCRNPGDALLLVREQAEPLETSPIPVGIYVINQDEEGPGAGVVLKYLEVREDLTIAHFETAYRAGSHVLAYPPSHEQALRLVNARTGEVYRLLDVDGIAIAPGESWQPAGGHLAFTATFDRIDPDCDRLHVVEGQAIETTGARTWTWLDISLGEAPRYLEWADVPPS